jgi:hypothetical protein
VGLVGASKFTFFLEHIFFFNFFISLEPNISHSIHREKMS